MSNWGWDSLFATYSFACLILCLSCYSWTVQLYILWPYLISVWLITILNFWNQVAKAPDGNGGVYSGTFMSPLLQYIWYWLGKFGSIWTLFFCACSALKSTKLLEDMASKGIKYIDCYGVDNALVIFLCFLSSFDCWINLFYWSSLTSYLRKYWLGLVNQVRVADPSFIGYFIDKGVAAAAKVVRKVTDCLTLSC